MAARWDLCFHLNCSVFVENRIYTLVQRSPFQPNPLLQKTFPSSYYFLSLLLVVVKDLFCAPPNHCRVLEEWLLFLPPSPIILQLYLRLSVIFPAIFHRNRRETCWFYRQKPNESSVLNLSYNNRIKCCLYCFIHFFLVIQCSDAKINKVLDCCNNILKKYVSTCYSYDLRQSMDISCPLFPLFTTLICIKQQDE